MGAFGQDFGSRIIRAFQAGQQERQQQQRLTQEEEERKLRMEALQLRLKQEKLQSKLSQRQMQLQEGMTLGPQMEAVTPGGVDVPDVSLGGRNLRAGIEREVPLELEAIPGAGFPARSVKVSDVLRQQQQQRQQAAMASPTVIAAGMREKGATARQGGTQTFTAEQNRLNREAENQRAAEANKTRVKAAGISASATAANAAESRNLRRDSLAFQQESTLRGQFQQQAKPFTALNDQIQRINAAADPQVAATGQNDIALIFNFMKMLDPTSVVRESEFATAANVGNLFQKAYSLYLKNVSAKAPFLTPAQREEFRKTANTLYESVLPRYEQIKREYVDIATRNQLDPRNIAPELIQGQGQGSPAGQFTYTATNPQTGQKIGSNDGVSWQPIQ